MRNYNKAALYPHTKMLSSTQFLDYEKSPHDFHVRWILDVPMKRGQALLVGIAFAELYADRDFDYRAFCSENKIQPRFVTIIGEAIRQFPELPKKDCEVELKCSYRGWKFRATLDGYMRKQFDVVEIKTGQIPWTQERTNFSDQLTFQSWVHWKKFGIPPRKIFLFWVNTNGGARKRIEIFKTSRSIKNLKMFERRVDTVIDNLSAGNFTQPIYEQNY